MDGHDPAPAAGPSISVVVPVFNNEGTLTRLVERIAATLDRLDLAWELIFVDDRSTDGSLAVLRRLCAGHRRVRVLALARNVGQNTAVRVGLASASGAWSVVLDADLQDPPEAIEPLLQHARGDVAAVFAIRTGAYQATGRMLTGRVFRRLRSALTGLPVGAGLFVMVDRAVRDGIVRVGGPSVVATIGVLGVPTAGVPVPRHPRTDGASAYRGGQRLGLAARSLGWILAQRCRRTPRAAPLDVAVERRLGFEDVDAHA